MRLYDYRQKLAEDRPDEDKGKLDVEAAYSDLGNELALYDSINNRMIDTPAMEEYMEQNPPEAQSEEEQAKVEKAFSLLNSKNAKSYLRTEEGIQYEHLLQKQQMEAWKDTYKGPKKKKSN